MPASVVVLRELKIVALAVHPHSDVADAGPGVEPGAERPEHAVVGGQRAAREPDRRHEERAALVGHGLRSIDRHDDLVSHRSGRIRKSATTRSRVLSMYWSPTPSPR